MRCRGFLTVLLVSVAVPAGAHAAGSDATGPVRPALQAVPAPTTPVPTTTQTTPVPTTPPAPAAEPEPGRCIDDAAIARASGYAARRPGRVSFAVFEHGEVRSYRGSVRYRSASIVKAMLLVADLRRHDRLGVGLSAQARSRLASMIRRSDNRAASATFALVGRSAMLSVARQVGMKGYRVAGYWSTSQVAAADQARFFGRLHSIVPPGHRAFARRLLRTIVPEQTWGGARIARSHGYRTLFKSGWLPRPDGWVVHQGLRIERRGCTLGIAVLTGRQRSMAAGVESIRGVTERLL